MAPSGDEAGVDFSQFQGSRRMSGRHLGVDKTPIYNEAAAFDAIETSKSTRDDSASKAESGSEQREYLGRDEQNGGMKEAKGGASNPAAPSNKTWTTAEPKPRRQSTLTASVTKDLSRQKKPVVMSPKLPYHRRASATRKASAGLDERRSSLDGKTNQRQTDQASNLDVTMADAPMVSAESIARPASSASSQLSDVPSDFEDIYGKPTFTSLPTTSKEPKLVDKQARVQTKRAKIETSLKAKPTQTRSGRVVKKVDRIGSFGGEMTIHRDATNVEEAQDSIDLPAITNTRKRKATADNSDFGDTVQPVKKSARASQSIPAAMKKLVVKLKLPIAFDRSALDHIERGFLSEEDANDDNASVGYNETDTPDTSDEEAALEPKKKSRTAATRTKALSKASAAKEVNTGKATSSPRAPATRRAPRTKATPASKNLQSTETATSTPADDLAPEAQTGLLTPPDAQPAISQHISEFNFDPQLLAISRKLTHRDPIATKPLPQGAPEVWADSRQALCETVPYFKMPQSGCHQNDRHVYSFLYDGPIRCREYMDAEIIIGGAGGGMEKEKSGQMLQTVEHSMSESQVQGVLNDIKHENPLIIICGNKSEGVICKMPHRYNVLGWYKPIAVWAEKTVGKMREDKGGEKKRGEKKGKEKKSGNLYTIIKYRFERLDATKKIWHAPDGAFLTDDERRSAAGALLKQTCSHCSKTHPMIYLTGWMCLTPDCDLFWKLPNGLDAPYDKDLPYNPAFLFDRTPWENEEEPYSVKPPVLEVGNIIGDNLSNINTRGMCCPECGRCNSRILFKGWKCYNPDCHFENFPKHMPVSIPMLHNPWENVGDGPSLARNKFEAGADVSVSHQHGFKVYRYTFPGIRGTLVHAISNRKINGLPGGPDEMFAAMQDQEKPGMDLHLERRRFGGAKASADVEFAPQALQEIAVDGTAEVALKKAPVLSRSSDETDQLLRQASAAWTSQAPLRQSNSTERADSAGLSPTAEELLAELPSQRNIENLATLRISMMAASLMQERALLEQHMSGMSMSSQGDAVMSEHAQNQVNSGSLPTDFVSKLTAAAKDIPLSTQPIKPLSPLRKRQQKAVLQALPAIDADSDDEEEAPAKSKSKDLIEDGDCMTAFSMNYGMPYKFVATGASLPFTGSPWPVRAARADLNWASRTLLDPTDHEDLNELLIFAYMEGQKLEYHDDGESGLGPRIATLSLGGKAKMHLRMKAKHYVGCSKSGVFVRERPVPGNIGGIVNEKQVSAEETYARRLAAWEELEKLHTTNRAAYNIRSKEIPIELGLCHRNVKNKHAPDMVTITLNHGDIVLMEGYEIQQYLEHKVVPENCLRFALTCRTIRTEHLKPEERPGYVVEEDDESMSSLRKMAEREVGKGKGKEVVMEG